MSYYEKKYDSLNIYYSNDIECEFVAFDFYVDESNTYYGLFSLENIQKQNGYFRDIKSVEEFLDNCIQKNNIIDSKYSYKKDSRFKSYDEQGLSHIFTLYFTFNCDNIKIDLKFELPDISYNISNNNIIFELLNKIYILEENIKKLKNKN